MKGTRHFFKIISVLFVVFFTSHTLAAQYSTGANDKEIRIGNTSPYTGPVSIYSTINKVEASYFDMINKEGGINGRKIIFISRDDAYNPANTVKQTRRLVESDKVLFIFNPIGTPTGLSVRDYLNRKKIPQLYLTSGSRKLNNPKEYPWSVPVLPSYENEARTFGEHILKHVKNPKIGVLYQNDDFGKSSLLGLEEALGNKAKQVIVGRQSYETTSPTVSAQIISLRNSGANVIVLYAVPRPTAQALKKIHDLNWHPLRFIPFVSNSIDSILKNIGLDNAKGIITTTIYKDINNPQYASDPGVLAYKAFIKKYHPKLNPANIISMYGYDWAQLMVHVLKKCGNNLTRENLLKQATNLDLHLPLLLPGLSYYYTPTKYSVLNKVQLAKFDGKTWQPFQNS